jgi:hypothetical protein
MAITVLSGLVDDADVLQNRKVIDMDDVVALLDPDSSQFTTMLMKVASQEAYQSKVEWLEDQLFPRVSTLAATIAASTTAVMTVATGTGSYFRQFDLVRVASTGEAVSVSAAPLADVVGISRGLGATVAASAASGGDVVILGNAAAQGATQGAKRVTKKTNAYNYTQIQRNNYGFTNTLAAEKLYGGSEPDVERRKKAIEHKRAIESILFWGARAYDTSGSEPRGYSGGIIEYLVTNIKTPAGAVTKGTFDGYFDQFYAHGSNNKVVFAAPLVARIISNYSVVGMGSAWAPPDLSKFGVHIDAWTSGAYGYAIPIIVKREWSDFSNAATGYGSWAFVVDMDYIKYRPLRGRSTKLLRNIQAPDADTVEEEYLTEFSLEVQQEKVHAVIQGMTS